MNSNIIKTIKYKDYNINIYFNEYAQNPREWENLGTMYCIHSRYNLGDKENIDKEEMFSIIKDKNNIVLDLYLYDHSGLSISCNTNFPFNRR